MNQRPPVDRHGTTEPRHRPSGGSNMDTGAMTRSSYVVRGLDLFAEYGDREALVSKDFRLTYAELRAAVLDMAAALQLHGVRPGSAVLMMLANPHEAPILQL